MDSVTYAVMIGLTFLAGVFVFTYFETPRQTINKGIREVNKGIKKVKDVQFLNIKKKRNTSFTISAKKENTASDQRDLRIYIHEH